VDETLDSVLDKFNFERSSEITVTKMDKIRAGFKQVARTVFEVVPPGRKRALVFTKLEEAAMWATKGISHDS